MTKKITIVFIYGFYYFRIKFIIIIISFTVFTFYPPHIGIFKDPMNKLIFKEGVELFMKDFTRFLFNRREGDNEK